MVVFGAPARSLQVGLAISSGSSGVLARMNPALQIHGICSLQKMSTLFFRLGRKVTLDDRPLIGKGRRVEIGRGATTPPRLFFLSFQI